MLSFVLSGLALNVVRAGPSASPEIVCTFTTVVVWHSAGWLQ